MAAQTNESNNSTTLVVVNFAPITYCKYYLCPIYYKKSNYIMLKKTEEKLHIREGWWIGVKVEAWSYVTYSRIYGGLTIQTIQFPYITKSRSPVPASKLATFSLLFINGFKLQCSKSSSIRSTNYASGTKYYKRNQNYKTSGSSLTGKKKWKKRTNKFVELSFLWINVKEVSK